MSERKTKSASRKPAVFVALALTMGLTGGCSSTPDWANPVEWYKGTRDWVAGDDSQAQEVRARDAAKREQAEGQSAPSLASVPQRPSDVATEREARSVQEGLAADRSAARHAALGPGDNATGRVDPADAPPPPPAARAAAQPADAPPSAPPSPYQPAAKASEKPSAEAMPRETRLDPPPAPIPEAAGGDGVREAYQDALSQSAPTVSTAPAGLRDGNGSSVPMTTTRSNTMPLPPAPRGSVALRPPPAAAPQSSAEGEGGPSGASVSVQAGTVLFGNGSSSLSKDDIEVLKNVVKLRKEKGGSIRVVGHASSRTRDVDPVRHRLVNFRLSLARANAVARQLVRLGVPADAVQVEARSDNDPVYYEFMPAGEAGNRRAEIYLDY